MKKIISKVGQVFALQAVVLSSFFAILTANAEMPAQPKPLWNEHTSGVKIDNEFRHDPNKYCVQCHTSANATGQDFHHSGKHFQKDTLSPNNSQPITCVSCHGNISEQHRKGVKDVMRFSGFGESAHPALERTVDEQNQVCMACHSPEKLREKFWAHDTHANKISCVSCHKLHPENDPMKRIEAKQRIKLCVDCHADVHARQQKLRSSTEEKGMK
ncbi:cytochrome c nitrite reductase pentaheme subunit [[Haemophilus] ducreyi]|uniref:Nitrate reductase, cytochrome-C type protein n=2 Tax=Haemophilus ducreyi TaxID=730 RepID=Q7VNX7_HAEDU|nr:cytochrome c nitrite reductase pentaheme subunit [[Haemophilus] ducreyi]AAP95320.1 nitrate reductase, cytochrome-C type protein [[Haemophilus] ducreyi 35000HP]AKO30445.1 cysteine dioxygenase [[Haemophilus] ducreyi]AKO31880.1 cysteine dioxygenase [[Haemophilus] ducreyi]AKO33334.1 cysteine dioxygenase [[Haemophilus] ducreyi]AKO34782.1 cysteine dioxygenase [[Haemophilus] ducreyi]